VAGRGLYESIEVARLLAVLDHGAWSLPPMVPHAPQDGLQPQAVLVCSPELHVGLRIGLLHGLHYGRELFLAPFEQRDQP
jgi:hypothetical protein